MSAKKLTKKEQILILEAQCDTLLSLISRELAVECSHDLAAVILRLQFLIKEMQ